MTTKVRRIFVVRNKVDFRRQHQGLLAEAFKLDLDPFLGDLLIFIGTGRAKLKLLYADSTGLWCSSKIFTLEAMKTKIRFLTDPTATEITHAELALVCEGAAYRIEDTVRPYEPSSHVARHPEQFLDRGVRSHDAGLHST